MDQQQLIKRLMATFFGELEGHVQAMNRDLLALEKDPEGPERPERLKALCRAAHSVKGAARSVNLDLIEEACHRIEAVFAAARDSRRPLDAELFTLLFAAVDALDEAGKRLRSQQDLAGSPLSELLPRLESAAEEAAAARSPAPSPPGTEAGPPPGARPEADADAAEPGVEPPPRTRRRPRRRPDRPRSGRPDRARVARHRRRRRPPGRPSWATSARRSSACRPRSWTRS